MSTLRNLSHLDAAPAETVASEPAAGELKYVDVSGQYRGKDLPNTMSVDVEDYFQVSAFEHHISRDEWERTPARLPANIARILHLFDAAGVKATFFTLGWVCEQHPQIVRDIVAGGHELASHGHDHARIWNLGRDKFRNDIESTRKRLEDVSGTAVKGYRAPSFSIGTQSLWAYDALQEAGYQYSSSVFPIHHDHYGLPDAPRFPFRVEPSGMLEIPMSSVTMFGRNWPCSGGGYFRLLPLAYSKWAARRINRQDGMPLMFYFHPWEIDPDQPRIDGISLKSRFRHYVNLDKFEPRLTVLLKDFRWGRVDEVFLATR
jgi:polysaccharide deacetylase family protein (PEP-CTERM system associated)